MLRSSLSFILVLAVGARVATAQGEPRTIAAAEAEGSTYPHAPAPQVAASAFSAALTGTSARQCVAVPRDNPIGAGVRSGDFVVGVNFRIGSGPNGRKIMWTPLHNPLRVNDTLVVRAATLTGPPDSLRFSTGSVAYQPPLATTSEAAFPSLVAFPAGGDWLVLATAGDDWGCFVMHVTF